MTLALAIIIIIFLMKMCVVKYDVKINVDKF